MVHLQRTSDEKRPGQGRQRINPREFATTGPRTPETAANYLLHRGLRQDGSGDQRGVSIILTSILSLTGTTKRALLKGFRAPHIALSSVLHQLIISLDRGSRILLVLNWRSVRVFSQAIQSFTQR